MYNFVGCMQNSVTRALGEMKRCTRHLERNRRYACILGIFLCVGTSILMPHSAWAGENAVPIIGWIEVEPVPLKSNRLAIAGRAYGWDHMRLRYSLAVKRSGDSGRFNNSQSGEFAITPGETALLSRTVITVERGDALEVELTLYAQGKRIFSAKIEPSFNKGKQE
jgi:hypothetical protein